MSLRKWLGLCEHKWVEIDRGVYRNVVTNRIVWTYFTYQCEHCKKLKEEKV